MEFIKISLFILQGINSGIILHSNGINNEEIILAGMVRKVYQRQFKTHLYFKY